MGNPSQDELYPASLVLPHYTDSERNLLLADVGTLIWNISDNAINVCKAKVAAAASWDKVTAVEET